MKITVLGLRGLPGVQGGVETHADQLYQRLVKLGCEVTVLVRTPWVKAGVTEHAGMQLRRIWSPSTPGLEAMVHSFLGVLYAAIHRPDVLHIHAVGPAITVPLARLLGLRVVVTHHGPDYDRDKWGGMARLILRTGERWGMRWANARIVISTVIARLVSEKYHRSSVIIPNGVVPPRITPEHDRLAQFGLEPGKYVLQVSRLVPEKRQLDLIKAFQSAAMPGWKLVLVGGLDGTDYARQVQSAAAGGAVVLTDYQQGESLSQLLTHAGFFVLPSSHEGLPIALLEALSYGLRVIASDIPANVEVTGSDIRYFPLGDTASLGRLLAELAGDSHDEASAAARRQWVIRHYDWEQVAERTRLVYVNVVQG